MKWYIEPELMSCSLLCQQERAHKELFKKYVQVDIAKCDQLTYTRLSVYLQRYPIIFATTVKIVRNLTDAIMDRYGNFGAEKAFLMRSLKCFDSIFVSNTRRTDALDYMYATIIASPFSFVLGNLPAGFKQINELSTYLIKFST